MFQNIETRRGDPLVESKKLQKNPSEKRVGILSMFSIFEIWDVDVFVSDVFWRFEYVLDVRS